MTTIRQDLLQQPQRDVYSNHMARMNIHAAPAAQQAVPTQTQQAVTAAEDTESLRPTAQAMADIKALIDQLNQAVTPEETIDALRAVQTLVSNNTGANMIGGALGELSEMADSVLETIQNDPSALGNGFAFRFNADFRQHTVDTAGFYQNVTSFSFSFSFQSEAAMMQGQMSFDERFSATNKELRYESSEQVSVQMVTYNLDMNTNPVLDSFVDLTRKLTGIDLGGMFEEKPSKALPTLSGGAYVAIDFFERLKIRLKELADVSDSQQTLIEMLQQVADAAKEEPAQAA